jgi:hypothetical protein
MKMNRKMISLFFSFFQLMEHRWNEIDRGKPKYSGEKPVPVPLRPTQIAHGLVSDLTTKSFGLFGFRIDRDNMSPLGTYGD